MSSKNDSEVVGEIIWGFIKFIVGSLLLASIIVLCVTFVPGPWFVKAAACLIGIEIKYLSHRKQEG